MAVEWGSYFALAIILTNGVPCNDSNPEYSDYKVYKIDTMVLDDDVYHNPCYKHYQINVKFPKGERMSQFVKDGAFKGELPDGFFVRDDHYNYSEHMIVCKKGDNVYDVLCERYNLLDSPCLKTFTHGSIVFSEIMAYEYGDPCRSDQYCITDYYIHCVNGALKHYVGFDKGQPLPYERKIIELKDESIWPAYQMSHELVNYIGEVVY